ncbi:MAG: alpha/beta hydrolase [Actinomycetota bacterium]
MQDRLTTPIDGKEPGGVSRTLDLDVPVHYLEWDGPSERTFVLVHGLGGSAANWIRVGPALAQRGRTIAVDLAGFGRTPKGTRSASLLANRRLLSQIISETASPTTVLAGNSMGGGLTLLQAGLEPGSVAGIVPTSSIWPPVWHALPAPIVAGTFLAYRAPGTGPWMMRQRFGRLTTEELVRLGFRMTTNDPSRIPPDVVQAQIDAARVHRDDPGAPQAFLQAARSIMQLYDRRKRFRALLDRITCPVLVVHGRDDRFVPVSVAARAWRDHPSWQMRIMTDCGHAPQLEWPDRWLQAVGAWIDDRGL